MKQFLFITCLLVICSLQAQENHVNQVQVGDELTLGTPSGAHYKHVDVPRKNFIIKRGGIADMSTLKNLPVTITDISYGKTSLVTFKRTDGKKFFRVYRTLTAKFNEAVDSGEVKMQ